MVTLPEPRNAMEALRQATVFARAEQIISDGYSFWPDASTSLETVRRHVEDRERTAMYEAQMAQLDELEDGRHFMEEIDLQRYLLR